MASEPEYVFTRDYIDNNRINLQHYQWVELFGYHIHPCIPVTDANLQVADVGTGTGLWLTDLSKRLPPTAQLDGFDISLKATPPIEWLPGNLKFRLWDVKEPVPNEFIEKYDIVHLRLFGFVLRDDEVSPVLKNVVRLLKPGGFLQWDEADLTSFRIEKTNPTNSTEGLQQLLKLSTSQDTRLIPTWAPRLPDLFSEAGLDDVQDDKRDAPGHLALAMHECNLAVHSLLAQTTKSEQLATELEGVLSRAAAETRNGACWAFTRSAVVGMKPTSHSMPINET
ncbi:S-adenosyl-L-methionine-dependent methyltransferase [Xylariaceae sp. FL0255]|nr:S-adenosyl-L-methionine-dependent methyltransferase [Xylariaceae sp. FL0255]